MKSFRLFDSVKNYYFEITFFIQNMKLKFYFGFDIDDSQWPWIEIPKKYRHDFGGNIGNITWKQK